ncbi:putative bifunctional diguanylate cyclase/phosphodiesterase [Mycolicibacterium pulveris]|uniref:putative bifunctional diguanylate cyclase/phosphodiesterase n=1 Tax=Mycolicibacterium pulveris TaxID=36813 RepID=UPI003CED60EB
MVALQAVLGIVIVVRGFLVARRVDGPFRWWRVLIAAACLSWLIGELMWWTGGGSDDGRVAGAREIVAYLLPAVLIFVAVVVLGRVGTGVGGGGTDDGPDNPVREHSTVASVLDGVVAALAFSLLSYIAGYGGLAAAAFPRSNNPTVLLIYSLLQLCAVVAGVYFAILYRPGRPSRANCLLLTGGVMILTSADRMVAYFRTVGVQNGDLWGGGAFVIGLVLVVYAMAEPAPRPTTPADTGERLMDWVQLTLPYAGFAGIAMLYGYHVLIGQQLDVVLVVGAVAMVLLVAARQVFAMRTQQKLTVRLYDTQRRLAHQLHHDALTGLPNRILFAQRLDEAMQHGRFVLIFLDLDDFKDVNDRFGHAAGDELLRAIGQRLKRCVRDTDTLARIGGDEFAILLDGHVDELEAAAERLRVGLRDPFAVHGSSVRVKASMGVVRPGMDGAAQSSDDLLRQADISMYAGKRLGKDTAVVYQPSSAATIDFASALRSADGDAPPGFRLVYQIVVGLPDTVPVAVEALARWTTPTGIEMSPETFVAAAEAAGLGAALDALVLDLACREVRQAGLDLDIHVNIGARRLDNPAFEQQVRQVLTRHGLPPGRLVLEITETLPIVDLAHAATQINRLNALGVKVALDDFGAGFNSLTYLHALPVHIVKLDRGLASTDAARDMTLYRSVIGLCHELGLRVIVEGIESVTQRDTVCRAGGRFAQGHLFGRPVPISELFASVRV